MNNLKILTDVYESGSILKRDVSNIIFCEEYCAKLQIYRMHIQQNREISDLYLKQFQEFNDKIFVQAMQIIDLAIENANVELAENALETVELIKSKYPDFYNSYFRHLLGK